MSRKIKFMAFQISRKKMYQVGNICLRNDFIGVTALNISKNESGDTIGINCFDTDTYEFELLEYIGIEDMYGNEIYENFILEHRNQNIFQVIHLNGRFVAKHNKKDFEITITGNDFKIIGNIYENPELLLG